jgi:O-acetyl-ADP-ribose deacetylase (regulator of RNase III)
MSGEPPANSDSSRSDFTRRVGPIEVHVRPDRLETIIRTGNLDAVVSSDDSTLSMSGGVSAAIAALAGTAIRNEVASHLPLPVGAVAITSAGTLPIKYIIHAVTVDWANGVLPTPRTIRQLVREILSRCEALRIVRIAIPALATGAADLSPWVSAKIIAQALHEHVLNPTVLRSVVLPIPEPFVYQEFAREFAPPASEVITGCPASDSAPEILDVDEAMPTRDGAELRLPAGAPSLRVRGRVPGIRMADTPVGPPVGAAPLQATQPHSPSDTPSGEVPPVADRESSRPVLGGRYVLLEEVGRGGMAVVHLSWDLVLRRVVAIKILRPDTTDQDSLKREAAAALELTHEGIVRIYNFEPRGGERAAYLVMEYLPWPSGEKWIADAGEIGLPVRSVIDVGVRICKALAHAHSRNILHLDIKPSNIFVDSGGENAKLGDFGLARVSSVGGTVLQLRPVGTPRYMAPEQIVLGARVSSATDVYQLGATLWDFLTDSPPPVGRPDLQAFETDRRRLLSVVLDVIAPDPGSRPSAVRLAEMVAAAS